MWWLEEVVTEGIQACIAIRLRNAPALETANAVIDIWLQVFQRQPIAWDKEQDFWRVRSAFLAVMGECETFPTPKKVLDFMPNRKAIEYRLPRPESNPMPENIRAEVKRIYRMTPSELCAETNKILNNMMQNR